MRFNSLADVPENIRDKVGKKMIAQEKSKVKYRNQPTTVNGIKFDSKKEAERYMVLMSELKSGAITDLRLQEEFTIQPAYTTTEGARVRAIRYFADFTYMRNGVKVVEDVKGIRTRVYAMKKKLLADRGIEIQEV